MFDILFGWSKATKCKKAIKKAQCRLRILKNKREAIARQLRKDLAELIQNGHEETAVNRVERLIEDECLAAAYELLDHFCDFILTQFSYIRRHKDLPNDINEAVSSLIFASARCGDLPELCVIRKLFGERYGDNFATTAVELFAGNLVNKQIKENLSGNSVPYDLKYKVIEEITRDSCLQQKVLAIEYYPDWQQDKGNTGYQVGESDCQINDTIAGSKVHPSEVEEIERGVIYVDSSISKPSDSCSLPESSLTDASSIVSTLQLYPPYILTYPWQKKVDKVEVFPKLLSFTTSRFQNKRENMALALSAERVSLPPYPEEMVDFLDEIEECKFSVSKDGACQDQRLFKFRSSGLSMEEKIQCGHEDSDMDQDELLSEKSSTRTSKKGKRAPVKRSRRRSASLESLGIMDIGYMLYYHKPCRSATAHKHGIHHQRKHRNPLLEGTPQSSNYAQKRVKQQSFSEKEKKLLLCQSQDGMKRKSLSFKMIGCSLNHPCYFCADDNEDSSEALPMKSKRGIRDTHYQQGGLLGECSHCRPFCDHESNQGMELVTIPQRPNKKSYNGAAGYHHVFTSQDWQVDNESSEIRAENSATLSSYASSTASNPRTTASLARTKTEAPYSRVMTMPQEQSRNCKDQMLRTYSCPLQYPNHVHPKLPDYDDIAAKFTALKRERLENKDCGREQQVK